MSISKDPQTILEIVAVVRSTLLWLAVILGITVTFIAAMTSRVSFLAECSADEWRDLSDGKGWGPGNEITVAPEYAHCKISGTAPLYLALIAG
jgi:hypothetical protein